MLRPLLACVPVVAEPGVTNHSKDEFFSLNDVNIQLNHVAEDSEAPSCHFIRIKQLYEILFAPSYSDEEKSLCVVRSFSPPV